MPERYRGKTLISGTPMPESAGRQPSKARKLHEAQMLDIEEIRRQMKPEELASFDALRQANEDAKERTVIVKRKQTESAAPEKDWREHTFRGLPGEESMLENMKRFRENMNAAEYPAVDEQKIKEYQKQIAQQPTGAEIVSPKEKTVLLNTVQEKKSLKDRLLGLFKRAA